MPAIKAHSRCQLSRRDAPFASYNLDSMTVAELMFGIDDVFHVLVVDDAATTVTTLRQLADLIDRLIAEKSASWRPLAGLGD